jgi:tetratricopeptide (TPR) repeat protein
VSGESSHRARLETLYEQYLIDQDAARFIKRVSLSYTVGTLERLALSGSRMCRRAAVHAVGFLGDYESNQALGKALGDSDRGVRLLADNALRSVWCRMGTKAQQRQLEAVIRANAAKHYEDAIRLATRLIDDAPWFAEAWNQRAIARYCLEQYSESIHDCHQTLELNPYHFGAASGMGQCFLRLADRASALECFRRALGLNPDLEGVRANVTYLERALKRQS